ncbi:DUF3459 domain-containing protein, partial [Pseudomonas chlororaphis]|uniref:DUF3459 domain-containing protein n=1 Tax=Pseudomonas chlororaphis TaxID=587753 RepID=UPI001B322A31
ARRTRRSFSAFADPHKREQIPDPNAPDTFLASRPQADPDQGEQTRALYRQLLQLRREHIVPYLPGAEALGAEVLAEGALCARWRLGNGQELRIDLNLSPHNVEQRPPDAAQRLFDYPAQAFELLQQGHLAPYSALVSLGAVAPLPDLDGERP